MLNEPNLLTHSTNIKDFCSQSLIYYWHARLSDFRIVFIDPNCANVIGYTSEEILSDPSVWQNAIHKDDLPIVINARNSLKENKFVEIEFRAIRKDGVLVWLRNKYIVINTPDSNEEYFSGVTTDITASRRAAQFLQNRLKLDEIISSSSASFVNVQTHEFDSHVNDVFEIVLHPYSMKMEKYLEYRV